MVLSDLARGTPWQSSQPDIPVAIKVQWQNCYHELDFAHPETPWALSSSAIPLTTRVQFKSDATIPPGTLNVA